MNFPPYNIYYIYVFDLSPWLISLGLNCLYNLMSLTHHSHCITYDLFQTFILYLSFFPLLLRNITIRATLFRSYIWCGYYVCLLPCETCLRLIQRRRMPSMKSKALWICCRIHVRPEPDCLQVRIQLGSDLLPGFFMTCQREVKWDPKRVYKKKKKA